MECPELIQISRCDETGVFKTYSQPDLCKFRLHPVRTHLPYNQMTNEKGTVDILRLHSYLPHPS